MSVTRSRAPGFTTFQYLAAVVFVVSFSGFMAMKYLASNHARPAGAPQSSATTTADSITNVRDVLQAERRPSAAGKDSGRKPASHSIPARSLDDSYALPPHAGAGLTQYYAGPQHAEWVDSLYAQLNSPEPLPAAVEETAPVISGRVLTGTGRPVPGVEVTAKFRDYFKTRAGQPRDLAISAWQTTANADGFYAFRDLPPGIYMVSTRGSGSHAPARIEVRTGVKYADLMLKPQYEAMVRGVVTDPMGIELDRVRIMPLVKGVPAGAESDARGEFAFLVALGGEIHSFPVRFQREGYREQRYRVTEADLAEDGSLTLAVTMEPVHEFSTVSGSLKDTDSLPVAGETVRLYSPSLKRNYRAVADHGGEFEFAEVEVADDYQLWVRPTGPYRDYTEQNVALDPGSVRRDIKLESLNRGYRLSGRILDQHGNPLPDFTLTLRSEAASGQKLPVTSDAFGDFRVENVPEGKLVFESRTMPHYILSGLRLYGDDTERHVDLTVNRGQHKLLGQVVNSDGRPVATPRVSITSSLVINGIRSRSSSSTSADADGRFVFTDLGDGQHTVTVTAPGYEGVRVKPIVGNQDELIVQLEEKST